MDFVVGVHPSFYFNDILILVSWRVSMFILFLLLNLFPATKADPFPDIPSITVEAHKDLEVYVSPIKVINASTKPRIEAVIGDYSAWGYASMHSHNAEISNGFGGYEPIGIRYGKFMVYNSETIKYAWPDCDYEKSARECSFKNEHFLLETNITVDDNQLVVQMLLFDSSLQIIASSIRTSEKFRRFIRQQEITRQSTIFPGQQSNCSQTTCTPPQRTTIVSGLHKPKEELPLLWEVPHFLLDKHVSQASILLWCSVKISE